MTGFLAAPMPELPAVVIGLGISVLDMSFTRKIAGAIGGASVLFFAIGVFLPPTARVERELAIDAHPATVFALLNDFHQVNKWSRWLAADPNTRVDISGPTRGVGATMTWSGNIIGSGTQVIVSSEPLQKITTRLSLQDIGDIDTSFLLTATEFGTTVLWRYENDFGRNIFARYYGLLLDGIVGADYELELASLKAMAESLPPTDFADLEVEHIVVTATDIAYMETSSEPLAAAISEAMGNAYFAILNFMDRHGLQEAGAPLSISRAFDGSELRFDAGIPVRGILATTPRVQDSVRLGRTYGGAAIRVKHQGSYRQLAYTHNKIAAYLAALGISRNGDAWESYVSDPTRTTEAELITHIFYPISGEN